MDAQNLELWELVIAEAVGLPLHELDLGVGALQGAGGDGVVRRQLFLPFSDN